MKRLMLLSFVLAFTAGGCLSPDEPGGRVLRILNAKLGLKLGAKPSATSTPAPAEDGLSLSSEQRIINAEFIKELFRVVVEREVNSVDEFGNYMNILDQGGHYDAIYNGMVVSAEYREKEKGAAIPATIKLYGALMGQLMLDQRFDPLKLEAADAGGFVAPGADKISPQPSDQDRANAIVAAENEALGKSLYFLKRRLGEEALKTIELKKEYREKFATWYGRFTAQLNKRGVDFGIPARNNRDEYFHYKWALDADEDRIKWECLFRLHVLMNAANAS